MPSKRSRSLDILRGVAVLGILVITIQGFSMPASALLNPSSFEDLQEFNLYVWLVSHIFADGQFLALFAMLFGAGIILISQKARKEHMRSRNLQYRRFFWLLIIGVLHAYLLWAGDILAPLALCGFIMYAFRNKPKEQLLKAGILFLLVGSGIKLIFLYALPILNPDGLESLKAEIWVLKAKEIEFYTSNWERQMLLRAPQAFQNQTQLFVTETFWRVSGLMLLGMAFYKKGILTAKQSKKYLRKMAFYGIGIGLPMVVVKAIMDFNYDWDFEKSFFYFSQLNYWGSLLMAIGYIGAIVYIIRVSSRKSFLSNRLVELGQMSLSNYILQSLICAYAFYGHGLGLFGNLDRSAQAVAVLAIWVFQTGFSAFWLKYFQYGPLEWIWRSLSYGRLQPLAKKH